MKTSCAPLTRLPVTAALAATCLLSLSVASHAQDVKDPDSNGRQEYAQNSIINLIESIGGNIVRQNSGQRREVENRDYYRQDNGYRNSYRSNSMAADVQDALARRGYYRGPIDGSIGRYSRDAIANYQQDSGLRVTGNINSSLLQALGLM